MSDNTHKQSASLKNAEGSQEIQVKWESSLPPPAILQEYKNILPDAAERYFSLWERQAAHRQAIERKDVDMRVKLSTWGMILGFIVNISAMGTAYLLATAGMDGPAIAATVMAALTNLIFFASFSQRK